MSKAGFDLADESFFSLSTVGQGPVIALEEAERIAREHFALEVRAERLTGERDENFRLHTGRGVDWLLKVSGAAESPAISDLCVSVLLHLESFSPDLPVPRIRRSLAEEAQVRFTDQAGACRTAMLYTFLPGTPLIAVPRSARQRASCARLLARMGQALRGFEHPAMHRALVWDLRQLPRLGQLIPELADLPHREFISDFVSRFATLIAPRLDRARRQFVHNDFNARNIIVDSGDESHIVGIIDFGDAVQTALVADVAVGVIGQLASPETADDAIREFIQAYHEVEPLVSEERALLDWLVAGRIVQNVVMTSWYRSRDLQGDGHFAAFDAAFFEWRIELAKRLSRAR
jgi:hydroxylysine kinase